ncbi:MAG: two-component regulator propeller domain-containing protein [Bacteroidia bacterium]
MFLLLFSFFITLPLHCLTTKQCGGKFCFRHTPSLINNSAIYSIIAILLCSVNTQAQTYNFTNHTPATGLNQAQVLAVYQDKLGVMWFGTNGDGITKYDGVSYEYITDKQGLPDNTIYCITEDAKGNVLIGTNGGLCVYNGTTFKNYTTENGLPHNRIFCIVTDSKHSVLLGTAQGIATFTNGVCKSYNVSTALNNVTIFNIYEDSKQTLWVSTLGAGVYKIDGDLITNYTTKQGLRSDDIYGIIEYEKKHFVLTNNGLFTIDNNELNEIRIPNVANEASYFSALVTKQNALWIGCQQGVLKYQNSTFKLYTSKNGLVDDNIWKVYEDREQNLWFASNELGVSKYSNESFILNNTKDGLIHNEVMSLFISEHKKFIGTKQGLSIYDNGKYFSLNIAQKLISNPDVSSITQDKSGNYLLGTSHGLIIYNDKKSKLIEPKEIGSELNIINDVFISRTNEVLLATQAGIATLVNENIIKNENIQVAFVKTIYQDSHNTYWIGTDDGLYTYDGKTTKHYTTKDGCTQKPIQQIIGDTKGNIWLATGAGIYCYNGKTFTTITEKNDLTSNDVYSIAIDKQGDVWAGFQKGLDKIHALGNGKYAIRHFDVNECSTKALLFDDNGHLLIGTKNGLVTYQPEYDRPNVLAPLTRIKSIDMFSRTINWKTVEEVDSVSNYGIPVNLTLPYNKNYLTFNYVGVSHTTPQKVRYQYMLKGLDKTWLPITQKTQVEYANLPFGKYEFLLKAENGEGVWNATPLSYTFEIEPPFWRTWWMYSIIAAVVLSLLYSYYNIRRASVKIGEQNIIIAEKNRNITDSINYAKRLQEGFLASEEILNAALPQHFVLFKPKDIVSGDFYWCQHLSDRTFIACADSTGHGIPGAFMSLIGINMLNECFHSKQLYTPEAILDELRRLIILALNPNRDENGGKDGMDMTLLSIPKKANAEGKFVITYAGAQNSLYIVNGQTQALTEYKTDKQPVAYYPHMQPFVLHTVEANKGDTLYMTTDGYPDQFGGEKGKKFMTKKLKELFAENSHLPINLQHMVLNNAFEAWKGNLDQVDDVTVIGIKL